MLDWQQILCSDCRKAQHIVAGIYTLLDVLHEVPTLPECLSPKSQKALSATCKSCHDRFIGQVQVVTIMRKEDYALVFKRSWPRLNMVILQYKGAYCSSIPPPNIGIFDIRVEAEGNSQSLISLLRPLHDPAIGVPCPRLAAQQLAHQMSVRWPSLHLLRVMEVHDMDGLYQEFVSQLVKGTWTHLADLSLSGCDLKAEGLVILSQGNWPGLTFLDVSGSRLDAEGMALLAKGNWPSLTSISLNFDPTMDAAAVSHLAAANWPIETLIIEDTPFSADLAAKLADLHFPELTQVDLGGCCGLTSAAVFELARADWPSLCNLSLDHDDPDAMAVLLGLDLNKMLKSDTRFCVYGTAWHQRVVSQPGVDLWPDLEWYRFSTNSIQLRHCN